jgi:hypothetical protein
MMGTDAGGPFQMDAIEKYQQAVNELKAAVAGAERIVKVVLEGAASLRDWKHALVANATGAFPPELGAARNAPLNANEWPSGQQLADSLIRYHDARSELRKAYEAVEDTHRGVVKPPESYDSTMSREHL